MRLVRLIEGHLQAQVTSGVVARSIYTWPQQANVAVGDVEFGDIWSIFITPTSWKLAISANTAKEVASFYVYFLTPQPQLDFDADANEVLIDNCIAVAVDLLARLRTDTAIQIRKEEVSTMSMYDVNNRNLTGVRILLEVDETQGRCIELKDDVC